MWDSPLAASKRTLSLACLQGEDAPVTAGQRLSCQGKPCCPPWHLWSLSHGDLGPLQAVFAHWPLENIPTREELVPNEHGLCGLPGRLAELRTQGSAAGPVDPTSELREGLTFTARYRQGLGPRRVTRCGCLANELLTR